MSDVELGEVKFFDGRDGKRFGFLTVVDEDDEPTGEEIWFHFNDGEFIVASGKYPDFSGKATVKRVGKIRRLRDPKRGDVFVFRRSKGRKGDKASPWVYLSTWQKAKKIIASRPIYRVQETMNAMRDPPGEPKILWQGSDLTDLMRKYPLPCYNQSPSADPLLSYSADGDNIFEIHRWWEKELTDGSWVRCKDPRPLPGVLRTFEAINR